MKQQHKKHSYPTPFFRGEKLIIIVVIGLAIAEADETINYEDIAPILAEKCVICHTGNTAPAGLRLDSYDSLLQGGLKGPVVKTGDPAASELIRRLKGASLPRMPMTGPPFLSDSQIAVFERWIADGLKRSGVKTAEIVTNAQPPQPKAGEDVNYLNVAPIFAVRCAKCHTDDGLMGAPPEGYRLTSYEATLATGDRVRVVPGEPGASELVRRVRGQARPRMPLDGPPYLADEEIRLIEDWIAKGARNSESQAAALPQGARVRLHGTLDADWKLDGFPLDVAPGTRIDKDPVPGDYIEVRGRLGKDGTVEVERIRRR